MPLADAAVWALAVAYLVPSLAFAARRLLERPWAGSSACSNDGDAAAAFVADDGGDARLPLLVVVSVAVAGLGGVGIFGRFASSAPGFALALAVTLPILVALAVIDVDVHRLPNLLTGALAGVVITGLTVAVLVDGFDDDQGRRAVVGAAGLGACYLVMALLGGGSGMGLGDVKLAPSLGALLAWHGWNTWLTGAVAAFFLGGAWGVVLMLRGQGRHARMPFGPFMIAGALAALCFA